MGIQDELIAVERELWKNDPERYRENYIDEARITFAETGVIDLDFAVEAIRQENVEGRHWAEVAFKDVQVMCIADDVALLLYRAVARWAHETAPISVLATTVYVRRHERWKAAHHQQSG